MKIAVSTVTLQQQKELLFVQIKFSVICDLNYDAVVS